jgi:uncharacterized protein with PIN domain
VIVVDTSALFAIATREDERDMFVGVLEASNSAICSTVTYVETIMVLTDARVAWRGVALMTCSACS